MAMDINADTRLLVYGKRYPNEVSEGIVKSTINGNIPAWKMSAILVNKDGNVIGNLFAAGELVGGVMGDDSPSGANNGWAVTSGKLAAESIAETLSE